MNGDEKTPDSILSGVLVSRRAIREHLPAKKLTKQRGYGTIKALVRKLCERAQSRTPTRTENRVLSFDEIHISQAQVSRLEKGALEHIRKQI